MRRQTPVPGGRALIGARGYTFARVNAVLQMNVNDFAQGRPGSKILQGHGVGGQLLVAAARRCIRASGEVGGMALMIDAKDQKAA